MDAITAATIEEAIKAGRIIEAKTLITMHESTLRAEERQKFDLEITELQTKAEAMIAQAEALEVSGQTEEAHALYASVLDFAADYPGIEEHVKRTNEAVLLAKAVQRRNRRIRETAPNPPQPKAKKLLFPMLGAGVAFGLVLVVLILVLTKPHSKSPPENVAPPASKAVPPPTAPSAVTQAQTMTEPSPEKQSAVAPAKVVTTQPVSAEPVAVQHSDNAPAATDQTSSPPKPPEELKPTPPTPTHIAASKPEPSLPANNQRQPIDMYTVQPGDSLSLIADRHLCSEEHWRKIYELNRDQINDPRKLQPGMVLRLTGIENRCTSPHN